MSEASTTTEETMSETTTMTEAQAAATETPAENVETTTTEESSTATETPTETSTEAAAATETPTETSTEAAAATETTETTSTTATEATATETGCTLEEGVTRTIADQADATALASCTTFSGSLAVATDYTGVLTLPDEVEEITGDLYANDVAGVTTLSGAQLRSIGGSFYLENLSALQKLDFAALTTVGTLNLTSVGAASNAGDSADEPGLSFNLDSLDTVTELFIHDTTCLELNGIGLVTVTHLTITDNTDLTTIKLPMTNARGSIVVSNNGDSKAEVSFNDLEYVGESISISQAESVSLTALQNGSVILNYNNFSTLSLPSLTSVTLLEMKNNTELANIEVPELAIIEGSGVDITGNNNLNGTIEFSALRILAGGVFDGTFEAVTLPALTNLTADLNFTSTSNIASTCSSYTSLASSDSHHIYCTYPGSSTTSSSSGSSSDKGATIGGSVGGVIGFFMVVGVLAVAGYFWWMRRKNGMSGRKGGNGRTFGDGGFELSQQRRRNY